MYKIIVTNNTCFNIDSDEELARLQANDPNLKILTPEEISVAGMNGYEAIVSPENTKIGPLGTVVFTAPDLAVVKQERVAQLLEAYNKAKYEGTFTSSEGFPVKVDDKLSPELTFLLLQFNTADLPSVPFIDANGTAHDLTKEQLRTVIAELNQYTSSLAATKAALEAKINNAATYAEVQAVVIDFPKTFTPAAVVLKPETSAAINEKTSGPAIARALEWVGDTDDALVAGAIKGLAKSGYSTSTGPTQMLGTGYTAWAHEFTGTGDITQTMPNITNERDGFLLFIKNSKTSGIITLVPGGDTDTIDGAGSTTVLPGHSKVFISSDPRSRWITLVDDGQHENKKPIYLESDSPVTIPDGWHRVIVAFQDAPDTITQTLPDLSKTILGAHMQVRNIRTDGGSVELVPFGTQSVNGTSFPFTVDPGTDVFLLAEEDDWFVWQTVNHEVSSGTHLTIDGKQTDTIAVQYPLEAKVNPDTNTATLNINPEAYQPMLAPGVYAALSHDVEVEADREAKVDCDEIIVSGRPFVYPDMDTKGMYIQDSTSTVEELGTPYLVVGHVVFDQIVPDDTTVTVRLWNKTQGASAEDILVDMNGKMFSTTKTYKAGEKIDTITLEGAVLVKQMQNIGISVEHNCPSDNLVVRGRIKEGTCLVAQAITKENRTGLALQAYEQDFKKSIFFEKQYFGLLKSAKYWLTRPQAKVTVPARTGIKQSDGLMLDNVSPLGLVMSNDALTITSDGNIADFFLGYELDNVKTAYLHGKDIEVDYTVTNPDCAYSVVLLKWTDKSKEPTVKKIDSRSNSTITWADGWSVADKVDLVENPTNTPVSGTSTFTIPADAVRVAVGFVPLIAQDPCTFILSNFTISTVKPFFAFELAGSDVLSPKADTSCVFELDTPGEYYSLRYTLPASFVACPPGALKSGSAKVTINDKVNKVIGSSITDDGGAYTFAEDGIVNAYLEVNLANETNLSSIATFQLFEFQDDGKDALVPNCSIDFKVPAKSGLQMYRGSLPTFMAKAGKTYGLKMKSTQADGAYIQANSAKPILILTLAVS